MFAAKNFLGVTLVELLLAITLSLVLGNILYELYGVARSQQALQAELWTLQERAQLASQWLIQAVHESHYQTCGRFLSGLQGTSQGIITQTVGQQEDILQRTMEDPSRIWVEGFLPVTIGDQLIITDCHSTESFKIKKIISHTHETQEIITVFPLTKLFARSATLNKLEVQHYFMSETHRKSKNHPTIYGLFLQKNNGRTQTLVDGITEFNLHYTVKTNHGIQEIAATELTQSMHVLGVAFALTFSTKHLKKLWYIYAATPQ